MASTMTPHQRLLRASNRGTGLRLSENEVWQLVMEDDAILTAARSQCTEEGRCTICLKLSCKDPTL